MFGYIRPNKGELLVREFSRFRSVYCGICKEIGRTYGQVPRVALTYDITMMGILMVSLTDENLTEKLEACILNPILKRPMLSSNKILEKCAALSVILAYGKFLDEIQDGNPVVGNLGKLILKRASTKAAKAFPEDYKSILDGLKKLNESEGNKSEKSDYEKHANMFGEILLSVFSRAFKDYFSEDSNREALIKGISLLGFSLGKWIFVIDAIDDLEQDKKNGNWNPFLDLSQESAKEEAMKILTECEAAMDRVAALLPYRRDAGIISNIIQEGLPQIRQKVYAHQKLGRL